MNVIARQGQVGAQKILVSNENIRQLVANALTALIPALGMGRAQQLRHFGVGVGVAKGADQKIHLLHGILDCIKRLALLGVEVVAKKQATLK